MFRKLAIATILSAVVVTSAIAGPPWIAIEYPVNPHDPSTRERPRPARCARIITVT